MLHPWTKYLGFMMSYCAAASAMFACITFSLTWGERKSNSWLIGMLLSTMQNIFLVQPLQVIVNVCTITTQEKSHNEAKHGTFLVSIHKHLGFRYITINVFLIVIMRVPDGL